MCYDSTSTSFIWIRNVRFYQLMTLPNIRIARLFLSRKIVDQNRDFKNHNGSRSFPLLSSLVALFLFFAGLAIALVSGVG